MKLLFLVGAVVLTGCATVNHTSAPSPIAEKLVRVPEINTPAEVTVGSTIFSQARYWSKVGYRLAEPVSGRVGLGSVWADAGSFVLPAEFDGSRGYCTEQLAYIDPIAGPWRKVCFVDTANAGVFDVMKAAPGAIWFQTKLPVPVRYETSELAIERDDAIKSELLYQGYANKAIKISYREYVRDFARPVFFQEVSYEVHEFPATITFRSVRIKLLSADNNGVRYQVLSGF